MNNASEAPTAKVKTLLPPLWTKGFVALLITQFLVALNDNIFRWLIIPIGKCAIGWSDKQDLIRTIGSLAFLLPFLLLATYAGYVCDRFNRRGVLIWCKVAELVVMILGTMAIVSQSVPFMLVTLFLMASQSTFFSPAKYGSLPNLVPEERISEANGYVSMTTMIACLGGQVLGGTLFVLTTLNAHAPAEGTGGMHNWILWSAVIVGVSILGLISSLFIPSIPAADPSAKFPSNPFAQTIGDLGALVKHRFLFWIAMASSFFWGLGALAQINIDKFATEFLNARQDWAMALLVALSAGLAFGALLAGKLSRGRIELGLVPIGAFFILLFCFVLSFTPYETIPVGKEIAPPTSFGFLFGGAALFLMGLSAGMFDIPLVATLQMDSPKESRGRILAAYNFFSFAAMALAAVIQMTLAAAPFGETRIASLDENNAVVETVRTGLNGANIWFVCGLLTIPVFVLTLRAFAIPFLRVCVSWWLQIAYRLNVCDADNLPKEGAVLMLGNHVSYLDALVVYCTSKRPVRFIADIKTLPQKNRLAKFVLDKLNTIKFHPEDRKSVVHMVLEAQAALKNGDVVCIFPEGGLTRNGQVRAFKSGYLTLLRRSPEVPILPFAITGFYGSKFAYAKFKGFNRKAPYRPGIIYGKPFYVEEERTQGHSDAHISQKLLHIVQELYVDMIDYHKHPENVWLYTPARGAIRGLRIAQNKLRQKRHFGDATGKELSPRMVLISILALRRALHRVLGKEKYIGVLLPTSIAGVVVNAAIAFDRRVPINLNYTFTNEVNNHCIDKVGIKKILASSQLLKKLPKIKLNAEIVSMEDLAKTEVKSIDKFIAVFQSFLPTFILERALSLTKEKLSDINTIIFTSGSTGMPKGAVLSNLNVSANAQSFAQSAMPKPHLSLYGVLPFFHSFGYTVTVWLPLYHPYQCYYHYNPLDFKGVGEVAFKFKPTLMVATPTFMKTYAKRCPKEHFDSVYFPIVGAEKCPKDLYKNWKEKFGHGFNEGFGATELSPVLSHNIPESDAPDSITPYHKDFSVGMPGPGFVVKIVDMETGEELPPNTPGMMLVKGNSAIDGYYKDPERSRAIFKDGWYVTGDVAYMDEDNFIFITGREARISKIGGEMAPHVLIEEKLIEAIQKLTNSQIKENNNPPSDDETTSLVVTAVPDERKGEKLVVLYDKLPFSPEEICKQAAEDGILPQLWIPSPNNFKQVSAIPVLGTGKLDIKGVKKLALDIYGATSEI